MKYLSLLLAVWLWAIPVLAHGGHDKHDQDNVAQTSQFHTINDSASVAYQEAHNTGTLEDFPRLHPLVVHFPVVFIILAFIIQIVSFFVYKKALSWVTLFLIVFGFI